MEEMNHSEKMNHSMGMNHYRGLLIMTVLSFISMFVLMYAMVDSFDNVLISLNQVYMAGLMTAPMVIIELLLMKDMYSNKLRNTIILGITAVAGILFFVFIRQQTAITDRQFLRSMIPHHGGAILMCGKAPLQSAEIKELCRNIIVNQRAEIAQMKSLLAR